MTSELEFVALLEPLRPYLEATERILQQVAAEAKHPLDERLREALAGGKRLRPVLVILAGQVFVPSSLPFYKLAAAVETLHTATLVHDDVVDGSRLRRGRRTMHTTWPVGAAILAGDYMLARAAGLVAEIGDPQLLRILTDALRAMCAGEIQQMFTAEGSLPTREAYYCAIDAKTASLLAAATVMSARLAGASEQQALALRRYGRELGIAFQITDDVLDFEGDERMLGKPSGSDLRQGMVTLPTLLYLESAPGDGPVQAVLAGDRDPIRVRQAVQAIRNSSAIQAAQAEARGHARAGELALDSLPQSNAVEMLRALAALVVERCR